MCLLLVVIFFLHISGNFHINMTPKFGYLESDDEQWGSITLLKFNHASGVEVAQDDKQGYRNSFPDHNMYSPRRICKDAPKGHVTLKTNSLKNTQSLEVTWQGLGSSQGPIRVQTIAFVPDECDGKFLDDNERNKQVQYFCNLKATPIMSNRPVTFTPCF
jgi:hypothetical protein